MRLTKTIFFLGCLTGGLGAALIPLLLTNSQADTKLLPFQGRLTDGSGSAFPDGAKVVEFKMYDAPTGGNVKWAGEVHKLSINGGLVNTMLGSKASLGGVDFSTLTFLQITVDANADNEITAADPPLLPRQSVIPAVYAAVSGQMQYVIPAGGNIPASVASKGWEAVFDNGRPDTGKILGSKLAAKSVGSAQIEDAAIGANHIAPLSVNSTHLAANGVISSSQIVDGEVKAEDLAGAVNGLGAETTEGAVTSAKIKDGSVNLRDLQTPDTNITAPIGGIASRAFSGAITQSGTVEWRATGLDVTLTTRGGPVVVMLVPFSNTADDEGAGSLYMEAVAGQTTEALGAFVRLKRNNSQITIADYRIQMAGATWTDTRGFRQTISIHYFDPVAAGTYTYTVEFRSQFANNLVQLQKFRLVAYELR